MIPENFIIGGIAALGAAAYCVWNFFKAMKLARKTPALERVDWLKVTMTVVPSLVGGFLAGYAISPSGWEFVLVLTTGWTAADIGNEVGADNLLDKYFS
jgi:hypothetical protein